MVTNKQLLEKSLQAAISAIEIYNKPDFRYREEAFAILMCNSWELLLKARVLKESADNFNSIAAKQSLRTDEGGDVVDSPKLNRSGNLMTVGLLHLATRMRDAKSYNLSNACLANLGLLVEVRDNAIHLVSDDLALSKSVLEIGTAALKNYMNLATEWFQVDLSKYNFFLMPISFFHGFEAAETISVTPKSDQIKKFLKYLAEVQSDAEQDSTHHVTLGVETRIVKAKGSDGLGVRWTNDPNAPELRVTEESLLEKYPYDSGDLSKKLRERYAEFKQDKRYYKVKGALEGDTKYCKVRFLDPKNPRSGFKKFFSTEVFKVFDLHYQRKASQ